MSDDLTPRLGLPYLAAAQAQKHVTVNEAFAALDGLVQISVATRCSQPPVSPADGLMVLLSTPGEAAFEGAPTGALMRFEAGAWTRLTAPNGAVAFVEDEAALLVHSAPGLWTPLAALLRTLDAVSRFGLNARPDASAPFAARLPKALFSADDGGDVRLALNKPAPTGTASLLLQTGWSGRAELGLVGDDTLSLKTSGDGSSWRVALSASPDGVVAQPCKPMAYLLMAAADQRPPVQGAPLALDTPGLDTSKAFQASASAWRCPAAGRYRVSGALALGPSSAGLCYAAVRVNGAFAYPGWSLVLPSSPGLVAQRSFECRVFCHAGDVLDLLVYPDGGSVVVAGSNLSYLGVEHLG